MRVQQLHCGDDGTWNEGAGAGMPVAAAQLVLAFGSRERLESLGWADDLRARFPQARIIGCSTAGEISEGRVLDDSLHATAIQFEKTRCEVRSVRIDDAAQSEAAGERLVRDLPPGPLAHVFVLSNGQHVNGSALIRGMTRALPPGVTVTGGLAGDGDRFKRTLIFDEGEARPDLVAAVALYGDAIRVGYGSMGGWDPFGPEREVTGVAGNVLTQLDGQPALDLYERYLGEHAAGLPATGLLFPLSVRTSDGRSFVRTILSIDRERRTLTFAGDIPPGSYARLMKANFDRLVDGAHGAAMTSQVPLRGPAPQIAILISCVGRKLVLRQRTEEEVEAVRNVLGMDTIVTGFYSYGEICPAAPKASCELHNQTMTITTLSEN